MESNGGGVCVPPSELCESNVNASTEHCNSDVAQESPEDIPPPQQEGWADAFLCAQCIRAKNRSTSDGCCDSLQCAFLRGFDLIDDIVVLDIPWSWESLFKCELSYSKVAAELKPLFDEAENAVTGLLWQMSTMIRQIVPFSQAEQNKRPFVNELFDSERADYNASVKQAFDALARMISLFAEHAAHKDTARASSSLSSSSSTSSSSLPVLLPLPSLSSASASPADSDDSPPFSKGHKLFHLLEDAAAYAQSWVEGQPIDGPHQPHCDAGEIATLALLATIRTVLKRLVNSVRKLHDTCVQRFPEVTFKPFQNKVRFHETIARNGIVEHDLRVFCRALFPTEPTSDDELFEEMVAEGLTVFFFAHLGRFTWGSDECVARYAEAERRSRAGNPIGNHLFMHSPSPIECGCAPSSSSSSGCSLFMCVADMCVADNVMQGQKNGKKKNKKKKSKKKKKRADDIEQEAQSEQEESEEERENKESEKEEKSRDEVKEKGKGGAETRNVKGGNESRGGENEREAKRDEDVWKRNTDSDVPCVTAELCPQCAQAKQRGAGEGWCHSLQCAFLRGNDMIVSLIGILAPFGMQLNDDKSEVTEDLLPLYAEAAKRATDLQGQLITMSRQLLQRHEEELRGKSVVSLPENGNAPAKQAHGTLSSPLCSSPASSFASSSSISAKLKQAEDNSPYPPPFAKDVWIQRLRRAVLRAQAWLDGRPIEGTHRPLCDATLVATLSFLAVFRTALVYMTNSARTLRSRCVKRFPEVKFKPIENRVYPVMGCYAESFIEHDMLVFLDGLFTGHESPDAEEFATITNEGHLSFAEANLERFQWVGDDVAERCSEAKRKARRSKMHEDDEDSPSLPSDCCCRSPPSSSQKQSRKKQKKSRKKKHVEVVEKAKQNKEREKEEKQVKEEEEEDERNLVDANGGGQGSNREVAKEEKADEVTVKEEEKSVANQKDNADQCKKKSKEKKVAIKEKSHKSAAVQKDKPAPADSVLSGSLSNHFPSPFPAVSSSSSYSYSSAAIPSLTVLSSRLSPLSSPPSSFSSFSPPIASSSFTVPHSYQQAYAAEMNNGDDDEGWVVQRKGREKQKGRYSSNKEPADRPEDSAMNRDMESKTQRAVGNAVMLRAPQAPITHTPVLPNQQASALSNQRSLTASNQRAPAAIPKHAHNSALPLPHPHPSQANSNRPYSLALPSHPPPQPASQPSRHHVSAPSPILPLSRSLDRSASSSVVSFASASSASPVPHTPPCSPHPPMPAPASRSPPHSPLQHGFPSQTARVSHHCNSPLSPRYGHFHHDGILCEPGSEYERQSVTDTQKEKMHNSERHSRSGSNSNNICESVSSNSNNNSDNEIEDMTCVVCQDARRRMCFVPCGHVVCCVRCAQDELMTACPMCRAHIITKMKIFF